MWTSGDRIELVEMPQDPDPIPPGSQGTIVKVTELDSQGRLIQLEVDWDSGRTLSPVIPPDRLRKLSGGN